MATNYTKEKQDRTYETPYGVLPSVTTVLGLLDKSGALMGWATKTMVEYLKSLADPKGHILITKDEATDIFKKARAYHKEISQKALDIGSGVHNVIEVHLKGQPIGGLLEADPRLKPPFKAFLDWHKDSGFKFIATERKVCSPLMFAGTLDGLAEKDGKLWVIDFKTSKAIYDGYDCQASAYRQAVMDGMYLSLDGWVDSKLKVDGGVGILRLDKETGLPEFKTYTIQEAEKAFKKFKHLLDYWWENKK
jgi:hypothetical protein